MNTTLAKFIIAGILSLGGLEIIQTANNQPMTSTNIAQNTIQQEITLEKAKEIALKKVNGTIQKTKEEDDEYEIDIKKGNYLYEIEVNKTTGEIDKIEKEYIKNTAQTSKITLAKAKEIALKKVNGTIQSVDYDSDDQEYEIEIIKGNKEYEIKVSAVNGKILEVEIDD